MTNIAKFCGMNGERIEKMSKSDYKKLYQYYVDKGQYTPILNEVLSLKNYSPWLENFSSTDYDQVLLIFLYTLY